VDPNQLSKFFPVAQDVEPDTQQAINSLLVAAHDFASTLQRLLPESQKKFDLHMGLLQIVREAEFALRLDGPTRTTPMIVTTRQ
jgi:hypothetical protein